MPDRTLWAMVFIVTAAVVMLLVVLIWAKPARSEELSEISVTNAAFCSLYSREAVFIDVMHGEPLTADTDVILSRAKQHYSDCLAVLPALMPLPADTGSLKTWLADIRDLLVLRGADPPHKALMGGVVASIGTVPASENPDDAAWREACAAEYLTWSEADGTVIRNGNPERVRCPLVLVDGAWVLP